MDNSNFLYGRIWILKLLEAAEWNGIVPVTFFQIHRFIYLANVLAPVCGIWMPESYTLKNRRGPYFPSAQKDLGRLTLSEMIDVFEPSPFSDENGFWYSAKYRINKFGISFIERVDRHDFSEYLSSYLREFMKACNDLSQDDLEHVLQHDIHYISKNIGDAVDYSEINGNSAKSAIRQLFPEGRRVTPREGIHRYVSYLRVVSGIAE
jgi:hypothetical protein